PHAGARRGRPRRRRHPRLRARAGAVHPQAPPRVPGRLAARGVGAPPRGEGAGALEGPRLRPARRREVPRAVRALAPGAPRPRGGARGRTCRRRGGGGAGAGSLPATQMTPVLAVRGRLIPGSAALLIAAGLIHKDAWPLVALGFVVVASLTAAYAWFYPT